MARGSKLRVATDERHVCLPGSHFPSGLFREYKLSKAPDPRLLVGPALSLITAALVNAKLDTMGSLSIRCSDARTPMATSAPEVSRQCRRGHVLLDHYLV